MCLYMMQYNIKSLTLGVGGGVLAVPTGGGVGGGVGRDVGFGVGFGVGYI